MEFTPNELTLDNHEDLALAIKQAKRLRRLVYFEITVTPVLAAALLEVNHPDNRNARQPHIDKQVRDLKNRRWQFNGESVKIDRDGYLIDGQKRCRACIEAGRSFKTLLVFNSDRLNINGSQVEQLSSRVRSDLPFRNLLAAAAKFDAMEAAGFSVFRTDYKLSHSEVAEATEEIDPESRTIELMRHASQMSGDGMASHAHYAWLAGHFDRRSDPCFTDDFFNMLTTGEDIPKGSPIGLLRRRLRRDKSRENNQAKPLLVQEKVYFVARTFVAWYKDESLDRLQLPPSSVSMETIMALLKELK
ncbi:MAG: hypothetical protein V3S71_05500 [Acidobacteriota bacterium]